MPKNEKLIKNDAVQEKEDIAIMELLGPKREVDVRLQEALEDLGDAYSLILLMPKDNYELRFSRIIKHFLDQKVKCVCVSVNKSSSDLAKVLEKEGLPSKEIFFIDTITLMIDGDKSKDGQALYLESPSELVELSVAIEKTIKKMNGQKVALIIDSIATLLVYNNETAVEKFTHALSQKMSDWNVQGVFLTTDSTSQKIIDTLSQFCDNVASL
jgi:KaiC/GvpD/RAD55 family RecA-like ATPase